MRITHVKLKDWGPHRSLDVDTDSSIVGVVGSNGSGKSNLLQAIDYAFTGNLNGRVGSSYIRNFGSEGGATKAVVEVRFRKGDKEGVITREVGARSAKRRLEWEGNTYTKVDEVEHTLHDILGTDKASLANAAFIKQGDIAAIVKGTPSERNDIFRKLIQLSFTDKRADDLASKQAALESGVKDYSELLIDATARLAGLKEATPGLKEAVTALEWVKSGAAPVRKYMEARRDAVKAAKKLQDCMSRAAGSKQELAMFRTTLVDKGYSDPDELDSGLDKVCADLKAASARLLEAANVHSRVCKRDAAASELASLKEERSGIPESTEQLLELCNVSHVMLDEARKHASECSEMLRKATEVDRLRSGLEEAGRALAAAKEARAEAEDGLLGKVEALGTALRMEENEMGLVSAKKEILGNPDSDHRCPFCKRSIELDTHETVEFIGKLHEKLQASITRHKAELKEHRDRLDAMYTAVAVAAAGRKAKEKELDKCAGELHDTFPDYPGLDKARDMCDKAHATLDSATQGVYELGAKYDKAKSLDKRISDAVSALAVLEEDVRNAGTQGDVDALTREVSSLEARRDEMSALLNRLCVYKSAVKTADEDMQRHMQESDNAHTAADELLHDSLVSATLGHIGCDSTSDDMVIGLALDKRTEEYTTALAELQAHVMAVDAATKECEVLREKIERNKTRVQLIDDLKKVRQLVGRNGIPLAYMNTTFKSISTVVQDLLTKMNANFLVAPSNDTPVTFTFTRTDNDSGYTMAQDQLSGGQAIRLALALLIACQQVVLPEMGLLVLDEPSSHIDDDGIASMRDMFTSLSSLMDSADMQLVIVDHNVNLMSAFNRTVKLAPHENA